MQNAKKGRDGARSDLNADEKGQQEAEFARIDAAVRAVRQREGVSERALRLLTHDWLASGMISARALWDWATRSKKMSSAERAAGFEPECELAIWLRTSCPQDSEGNDVFEWARLCQEAMADNNAFNPMALIATRQGPLSWIDILLAKGRGRQARAAIERIPGAEWPSHWDLLARVARNSYIVRAEWEDIDAASEMEAVLRRQTALNAEAQALAVACEEGEEARAKETAGNERPVVHAMAKRI